MKKYLYTALVVFCFNVNITAEEVTMESDGTIMEFNYLTVTDPQSFMMALDKFDKGLLNIHNLPYNQLFSSLFQELVQDHHKKLLMLFQKILFLNQNQ